jgi:hypothetical protein
LPGAGPTRRRPRRPPTARAIRDLVVRLAGEYPGWAISASLANFDSAASQQTTTRRRLEPCRRHQRHGQHQHPVGWYSKTPTRCDGRGPPRTDRRPASPLATQSTNCMLADGPTRRPG